MVVVVKYDEQVMSPLLKHGVGHVDQRRLKVLLSQMVGDEQCHLIHDG